MWLRYLSKNEEDFDIPIVSVGNLNVGGSGKTPLVTALAQRYKNSAIVLRGYGRKSQGLHVVSDGSAVLCDVDVSGDEARIYADKLSGVVVIVSEDRKKGILKAKEMGANIVFLDDAYSKHDIKKLDLVIHVETTNKFCLPSGAFRERLYSKKDVIVLHEDVDFRRVVTLRDKTPKMSLLTAIARPKRLDKYLVDVVSKNYFEDHHEFTEDEVISILDRDGSDSLLVTYKDYVKLCSFDVKLSLLDLEVEVSEDIFKKIDMNFLL